MSIVHIHARDIARHDAVGNFARQVAALVERNHEAARLWADYADPLDDNLVGRRRDFWGAVQPDDLIFFHLSIYDPDLERLAALPNRKVLFFHNITPPELIDPDDGRTIENCRQGLAQRSLAQAFDVLMANSAASADALLAGMSARRPVVTCPPVIGLDRWSNVVEEPAEPDATRRRLLYVGRLVHNKGVKELIEVFAALAERTGDVALDIAGTAPESSYVDRLRQRAADVTARHAAPVRIHHGPTDGALKGLYKAAAACITMTRHEGFCVPAIDALVFGKPFFATPVPALGEVLGDAGITLPFEGAHEAAAIVAEALADEPFLAARKAATARRLAELHAQADGRIILEALNVARAA